MKKFGIRVLKYILVFVILIASYVLLGTVTSLIPSKVIEENVKESSETLYEDNEKKEYDLGYKKESIFTFTDALMINTAYSVDSTKPVSSFLLARKNYIPGQTKYENVDSQYNLGANEKYKNPKNGDLYQTKELYGLMHDDKIEDSYEYARYWHGYLVVLRPLLVSFNYSAIRVVQMVTIIGLMTALIFLIYKKIDLITAIIYLFGLLSIYIFIVANSINESWIYILALITSIILLIRKDKIKDMFLYFFIIGSITNFIDLLTAPLVSLGLTATTYFLILQKEQKDLKIKDYILEIFKVCIAWILGYGLTWFIKWVIVEIGLNRNLISQAIEQVKYRMLLPNGRVTKSAITTLAVFEVNLMFLSNSVIYFCIAAIIAFVIIELIKNRNEDINFKENLKHSIPYIVMFILPFGWYIALKQHSYVHRFFTYRILFISIINLFLIIKTLFKPKKKGEQK